MGALDLSVQVLNISLRAIEDDLIVFFSYCEQLMKSSFRGNLNKFWLFLFSFAIFASFIC